MPFAACVEGILACRYAFAWDNFFIFCWEQLILGDIL